MALMHAFLWIARSILTLFTRTQANPQDPAELRLNLEKPVCYVLRDKSLADFLVVDAVCKQHGLPRPTLPLSFGAATRGRSVIFLTEKHDALGRKKKPGKSPLLEQIVEAGSSDADSDIQLVPVSVFWGRAPNKENSLFKLLFSDTWAVPGMLRKLFLILVQGRRTLVYFNEPISLREVLDENLGNERTSKKLARVLRVHFRRLRAAVIGPDLSHRRTIVNGLLRRPAITAAIAEEISTGVAPKKAATTARKYANEIAADYSHAMIRAYEVVLSWLWTKLYDGVNITHMDRLTRLAKEHEIIYVPCHRSHIDYLLLSYVLYRNNLVPPHIAAGINLNLPVVGSILRGGGAFFLRRSFKGNQLYSVVFNEYVSTVFERGFPMEYFIEGGRSRTGRLLSPRPGMLAMTLRSYLNSQRRSFVFVPVYFGYERIIEGRTYVSELFGSAKKKESVGDIFRTLRKIKGTFGKVHVNFGEPIPLTQILDSEQPGWQKNAGNEPADWTHGFVNRLGQKIITNINSAAVVNPVSLLSLVMLSTPKHAMDEQALRTQIDIYLTLLRSVRYSDSVIIPDIDGNAVIAYCEKLEIVRRQKHAFGDIMLLDEEKAVTLTYFRNNNIHLFALPGLIACLVANNRRLPREELVTLCKQVYPFMKSELFIHWDAGQIETLIDQYLALMQQARLLEQRDGEIWAPDARSVEYVSLTVLGSTLKQTLERFYIALEILQHFGSGKITRPQLEELCHLMAQRMAMLHEFRTPEFSDKALFRNFVQNLLDKQWLQVDEQGLLSLDARMQNSDWHSDRILGSDVRVAIQQVTSLEASPQLEQNLEQLGKDKAKEKSREKGKKSKK